MAVALALVASFVTVVNAMYAALYLTERRQTGFFALLALGEMALILWAIWS